MYNFFKTRKYLNTKNVRALSDIVAFICVYVETNYSDLDSKAGID